MGNTHTGKTITTAEEFDKEMIKILFGLKGGDPPEENKSEWVSNDYLFQPTTVVQPPEVKDAVDGLDKIIKDYNITKEEKLHAIMEEENFNA